MHSYRSMSAEKLGTQVTKSKYLLQLLPLSFSPSEETLLALHFFPTLTPFLRGRFSCSFKSCPHHSSSPSCSICVCTPSTDTLSCAAIPADVHEGSPNVPQPSYSSLETENPQGNSESGMQGRSSKGRKLTGKLTVPVQGAGKWVS